MEMDTDITLETLCRVCIKPSPDLRDLFQENFVGMLKDIAPVSIEKADELPQQICNQCINEMSRCYAFRLLIMQSDADLRVILSQRKNNDGSLCGLGVYVKVENDNMNFCDLGVDIKVENNDDNVQVEHNDDNNFGVDVDEKNNEVNLYGLGVDVKQENIEPVAELANNLLELDRHENISTVINIHQCEECKKIFGNRPALTRHMKVHLIDKQHKCTVCPAAFAVISNLTKHLKTHSDQARNIKCDECELRFIQKSDLTKHMRTHTGEKPYNCNVCSKAFRSSQHVDIHMKIHGSNNKSSSSSETDLCTEMPQEHRETSFHSADTFDKCRGNFPEFDLTNLLQGSPMGGGILRYYEEHNNLSMTLRNRLADIIIRHLFDFISKRRLTDSDYRIICSKILALFPTESPLAYYVPLTRKINSPTGKTITAKGKLVDKARNILFKSGTTVRIPKKLAISATEEENILPDDQLLQTKQWLAFRSEPYDEVVDMWKKTRPLRKASTAKNLHDFLEEWPILRDSRSVNLINIDFDELFPSHGFKLIENWDTFFEAVCQFSGIDRTGETIGTASETIKDLFSLIRTENDPNDCRVAVQLNILPHLLPPKCRKRLATGKCLKYSIQECIDSIIIHCKSSADIHRLIEVQKEKVQARGDHVQPYLLVEGASLGSINNVYVIIDSVQYHCKSVLEAMDICFKCFHTLNGAYPSASEHIYSLIQKAVYNICTPVDKIYPAIEPLLKFINNI